MYKRDGWALNRDRSCERFFSFLMESFQIVSPTKGKGPPPFSFGWEFSSSSGGVQSHLPPSENRGGREDRGGKATFNNTTLWLHEDDVCIS